jgi:hypothetical protein
LPYPRGPEVRRACADLIAYANRACDASTPATLEESSNRGPSLGVILDLFERPGDTQFDPVEE